MPRWLLAHLAEWLPRTELKSGVKSLLSIFEPLCLLISYLGNVTCYLLPTRALGFWLMWEGILRNKISACLFLLSMDMWLSWAGKAGPSLHVLRGTLSPGNIS